jgi:hypothetical protein
LLNRCLVCYYRNPRGQALQEYRLSGVAAERSAEAKVDIGDVLAPRTRASTPDDESRHVPTADSIEKSIAVSEQDRASDSAAARASPSLEWDDALLRAALEQFPAVAVTQPRPMPRTLRLVTSLRNLEGIEPIAEALNKDSGRQSTHWPIGRVESSGAVTASGVAVPAAAQLGQMMSRHVINKAVVSTRKTSAVATQSSDSRKAAR